MKRSILISFLFLFPVAAVAQQDVEKEKPITKARAEAFVACLADMIELEEKYADDESMYEEDDEFEDWASMIAAMESHPAYQEVLAVVQKHGFEGAEDWASTSARFFSAYTAVKMGDQEMDMEAEVQKAIDAINENEMLSAEDKEAMIETMRAQQEVYETFQRDVSESEKEAVRSVLDEFEAITMEEEEEEYDMEY
jgi:hypothetical protein